MSSRRAAQSSLRGSTSGSFFRSPQKLVVALSFVGCVVVVLRNAALVFRSTPTTRVEGLAAGASEAILIRDEPRSTSSIPSKSAFDEIMAKNLTFSVPAPPRHHGHDVVSRLPPAVDNNNIHPKQPEVNLLDPTKVFQQVSKSRQTFQNHLQSLYGEYYWNIFEPFVDMTTGQILTVATSSSMPPVTSNAKRVNIGRLFYKSPGDLLTLKEEGESIPFDRIIQGSLGWQRMVRKMTIKLLLMQLHMIDHLIQDVVQNRQRLTSKDMIQFRWVTAGNGQASGLGNLNRESYTSVLENSLQDIFASIGIHFTASNYAIARSSSGDETALCINSLYGHNIDALYWNFEMTDEKDYWKMLMFARRSALLSQIKPTNGNDNNLPSRPALVAYQSSKTHTSILAAVEQVGMTVLGRDTTIDNIMEKEIYPDSVKMTQEEVQNLPPHLRYIRCDKEVEDGGPVINFDGGTQKMCRVHKFNLTVCPKRPNRSIWLPGWKVSAVRGFTLANMLLEVLNDAVVDLRNHGSSDETPKRQSEDYLASTKARLLRLFNDLNAAEQADYDSIVASNVMGGGNWLGKERKADIHREIDLQSLFQEHSFCHTALLPSELRYRGLLQGEDATEASPEESQNATFTHGTFFSQIRKFETNGWPNDVFEHPNPQKSDKMLLVTDQNEYASCEEQLGRDHQDAFMVTSAQGWRKVTIPNDAEIQHYKEFSVKGSKGWVILCFYICNNSKCAKDDLHDRIYNKKSEGDPSTLAKYGRVEMEINGITVTDYTRLIGQKSTHLDNCVALKHANATQDGKYYSWAPSADGRYELHVRIVDASTWSHLKISSIILM